MDADPTKKDMMDINCLSSGSTLLIKIDSVNVIQNQLDKFLEKFVSHEKIYHDAKLPLFIVDSFSKLFKHWLEFPDLKKLIGNDVFEEIFKEMANVFEPKKPEGSSNQLSLDCQFGSLLKEENSPSNLRVTSPPNKNSKCPSLKSESPSSGRQNPPSTLSYFKLFCNECNDDVQIVNDDPRLSYNLHVHTPGHLMCYDPPKTGPSPSNINDAEEAAFSTVTNTSNSNVDSEILNAAGSSNSDDSENLKAVNQYKLPTLYDPFCEPCCKNINTKELFIGRHLQSRCHEKQVMLYEESKKILQEYGYYFSITNKDTFEFRCHICMKKQTGTNCFIQHCNGVEHQTNLQEIEIANKIGAC